jgi:hypothetical protein
VALALAPGSTWQAHVEVGLQALRPADKSCFAESLRSEFGDSLDLDAASRSERGPTRCWDYLVGHTCSRKIIAVEPHNAATGEVGVVIEKRRSTCALLSGHMRPDSHIAAWIWVPSGRVDIVAFDRAQSRLASEGIHIVGRPLTAQRLGLEAQHTAGDTNVSARRHRRARRR